LRTQYYYIVDISGGRQTETIESVSAENLLTSGAGLRRGTLGTLKENVRPSSDLKIPTTAELI